MVFHFVRDRPTTVDRFSTVPGATSKRSLYRGVRFVRNIFSKSNAKRYRASVVVRTKRREDLNSRAETVTGPADILYTRHIFLLRTQVVRATNATTIRYGSPGTFQTSRTKPYFRKIIYFEISNFSYSRLSFSTPWLFNVIAPYRFRVSFFVRLGAVYINV